MYLEVGQSKEAFTKIALNNRCNPMFLDELSCATSTQELAIQKYACLWKKIVTSWQEKDIIT